MKKTQKFLITPQAAGEMRVWERWITMGIEKLTAEGATPGSKLTYKPYGFRSDKTLIPSLQRFDVVEPAKVSNGRNYDNVTIQFHLQANGSPTRTDRSLSRAWACMMRFAPIESGLGNKEAVYGPEEMTACYPILSSGDVGSFSGGQPEQEPWDAVDGGNLDSLQNL
jgi:hypothetical protein